MNDATTTSSFFANSGVGPTLIPLGIGHRERLALIDPESAFWTLVPRSELGELLRDYDYLQRYQDRRGHFLEEMKRLRFNQQPSAVYLNPTERCNLDCRYCYLPREGRLSGEHMSTERLREILEKLDEYFHRTLPQGRKAQIIFHGAEPLLVKEQLTDAITRFGDRFHFGVQTNGTLLDAATAHFFKEHRVTVGLSLDGARAETADRTRVTWSGEGVFEQAVRAIELLKGYSNYNVICTMTRENMEELIPLVRRFHEWRVPAALINLVRCTEQGARPIKPEDRLAWSYFEAALEENDRLRREGGHKLVIANFANILLAILAPTARKLLCDISPCGGARAFFAVTPSGDLFPCSEFIGLSEYRGGNILEHSIDQVLGSAPFQEVANRSVEGIEPCRRCAIHPFCGAPCPAEARAMNGRIDRIGAFCEFYEHQVRYAFRLIADERHQDFLWDDWDRDTTTSFEA